VDASSGQSMGRLSLFLAVRGEINAAAVAPNECYCVNQHAPSVWRELLLPRNGPLIIQRASIAGKKN